MSDAGTVAGSSTPTIRGVALTDLSATIGAVVWLVAILTGELGLVERALALAPLVLVPMGIGMAATPSFEGIARLLHAAAIRLQPLGALGVLLSLAVDGAAATVAMLALPWVGVAGLLGLTAAARTYRRGLWPLSETAVDTGFAYTIVGAVALILHHLGITLWFRPVIVLLTAVHFHYAGFVLPVATGLVGRCGETASETTFRALAGVVLLGPAIIAVGISFSPVIELLAVGGFTLAVSLLGGYVAIRIAPTRPRTQSILVAGSAIALPLSMVLALGYAVGAYTGSPLFGLGISRMIALHGSLNAYGFGLGAMVGWRVSVPVR